MKPSDVKVNKNEAKVDNFVTEETVLKRSSVKLGNIKTQGRLKRECDDTPHIWFDTIQLKNKKPDDGMFIRVINSIYSGVVVYLENINDLIKAIPERMQIVLKIRNETELKKFHESVFFDEFKAQKGSSRFSVAYHDVHALKDIKKNDIPSCYICYVDDQKSLLGSISDGIDFDYLWILFRDPTNIPLELVIASLQSTHTILMKEVKEPSNVDDAIVSYGVMEYGAEGVIFSPVEHDVMSDFLNRMSDRGNKDITIQVGTVMDSRPVGMGYRACIDTATLFQPDEGILVGNTSQGGLLCCAEVFFLPYMELRPFRVNAGAMHSYVFNQDNLTDYMSELKTGSPVMVVNAKGRTRRAAVGRMKIELRPLRLIEVEFSHQERVSVIMQDDWHVRIFSDAAKPLNISELKAGDKVLGYVTEPGRHVGIKINESIIEK